MMERISQALRGIVRTMLIPVDYYALYPAVVLLDYGDMRLDVQPDSDKLPQMTAVPLMGVLPNCKVKVKRGARVLLGFENGEPTKPRCHIFDSGALELLELRTGLGHRIVMDDDRGQRSGDDSYSRPHVQIQSKAGHRLLLWDVAGQEKVELKDATGQRITLDAVTQQLTLQAHGQIRLDAPLVLAGGKPVAHVGDKTSTGGVILPV